MAEAGAEEVSGHWGLDGPMPEEVGGGRAAGKPAEKVDRMGEMDEGRAGREEEGSANRVETGDRRDIPGGSVGGAGSGDVLDAVGEVKALVLDVQGRVAADGAERAVWARKAAVERRRARVTAAGFAGALALGLLAGGAVGMGVAGPPEDTTRGWRDHVWKVLGQEARACLLSVKKAGPGWTCTVVPAEPKPR